MCSRQYGYRDHGAASKGNRKDDYEFIIMPELSKGQFECDITKEIPLRTLPRLGPFLQTVHGGMSLSPGGNDAEKSPPNDTTKILLICRCAPFLVPFLNLYYPWPPERQMSQAQSIATQQVHA
jgi:hypothetical protein